MHPNPPMLTIHREPPHRTLAIPSGRHRRSNAGSPKHSAASNPPETSGPEADVPPISGAGSLRAGRCVPLPTHRPATPKVPSLLLSLRAREYFAVSGSRPCPRYSPAACTTSSPSNPQRSSPGTADSSQGSGTTAHSDATPDGHLNPR